MTQQFNVTMTATEGMSEQERQRRIHQAYAFILSLRARKAADPDKAGNQKAGPAADDTSKEMDAHS